MVLWYYERSLNVLNHTWIVLSIGSCAEYFIQNSCWINPTELKAMKNYDFCSPVNRLPVTCKRSFYLLIAFSGSCTAIYRQLITMKLDFFPVFFQIFFFCYMHLTFFYHQTSKPRWELWITLYFVTSKAHSYIIILFTYQINSINSTTKISSRIKIYVFKNKAVFLGNNLSFTHKMRTLF